MPDTACSESLRSPLVRCKALTKVPNTESTSWPLTGRPVVSNRRRIRDPRPHKIRKLPSAMRRGVSAARSTHAVPRGWLRIRSIVFGDWYRFQDRVMNYTVSQFNNLCHNAPRPSHITCNSRTVVFGTPKIRTLVSVEHSRQRTIVLCATVALKWGSPSKRLIAPANFHFKSSEGGYKGTD